MFFHLLELNIYHNTTLPLCYRLQCLLLTLAAIFRLSGFVYLPQGVLCLLGWLAALVSGYCAVILRNSRLLVPSGRLGSFSIFKSGSDGSQHFGMVPANQRPWGNFKFVPSSLFRFTFLESVEGQGHAIFFKNISHLPSFQTLISLDQLNQYKFDLVFIHGYVHLQLVVYCFFVIHMMTFRSFYFLLYEYDFILLIRF